MQYYIKYEVCVGNHTQFGIFFNFSQYKIIFLISHDTIIMKYNRHPLRVDRVKTFSCVELPYKELLLKSKINIRIL